MKEAGDILEFDDIEWREYFLSAGKPAYRAEQVFTWFHKHLARTQEDLKNLPKDITEDLKRNFQWPHDFVQRSVSGESAVEKFLFTDATPRKKVWEAVWLPYENRQSVCVSVQSGCTLDCEFCATGKMKFGGNLSVQEMLSQVYSLQREKKRKVSNVVFMGMGEPFHNYDQVLKAAELLNHPKGQNIGARHITISTSGILPGIERFVKEKRPFSLAISVHAANPEKRAQLMDVEKKYPIRQIFDLLAKERHGIRKNRLTFEYILIENINMTSHDAELLADAALRCSAKINLIPLNTDYNGMKRPSPQAAEEFQQELIARGVKAFNRQSPGLDIEGACGMLAANSI